MDKTVKDNYNIIATTTNEDDSVNPATTITTITNEDDNVNHTTTTTTTTITNAKNDTNGVLMSMDDDDKVLTEFGVKLKYGRFDEIEEYLKNGGYVYVPAKLDGTSVFNMACCYGMVDVVELFLKYGALLDAGSTNNSALSYASYGGHVELVKLLLERNANPNDDVTYSRALSFATFKGYNEITSILLNAKANVNSLAKDGISALIWAAQEGHVDCVKTLIAANVDVNHCVDREATVDMCTALYAAVRNGKWEVAKLLLCTGNCDVNVCSSTGSTPLHHVCAKGKVELTRMLLEAKASVNCMCESMASPAIQAVMSDSLHTMKLLLEYKADVTLEQQSGSVCLHYSCSREMAELLVEHNADVHKLSNTNDSALHYAVTKDNVELVEFLLSANVDINAMNLGNLSPLGGACIWGRLDVVRVLVEANASLNPQQNETSPLWVSVVKKHLDVTKYLLEAKVDVNYNNDECSAAIDVASSNLDIECVEMLLSYGSDHHNAMHSAAWNGHAAILRVLLENGGDANDDKQSPLVHASATGHTECVKLLVDNGANVDQVDEKSRYTPLYAAVSGNHGEVVKYLLEAKADPNFGERKCLVEASRVANDEVIMLLLLAKADVSISDALYQYMCASQCSQSVVCEFINDGADVNFQHPGSKLSLLMVTSMVSESVDAVEVLLNAKADPLFINDANYSALHCAIEWGAPVKVCRRLLEAKCEPTPPALQISAIYAPREVVQMLLEFNASVDDTSFQFDPTLELSSAMQGNTALCLACLRGRDDVVRVLIDGKASLTNVSEKNTSTALTKSKQSKNRSVFGVLLAEMFREKVCNVESNNDDAMMDSVDDDAPPPRIQRRKSDAGACYYCYVDADEFLSTPAYNLPYNEYEKVDHDVTSSSFSSNKLITRIAVAEWPLIVVDGVHPVTPAHDLDTVPSDIVSNNHQSLKRLGQGAFGTVYATCIKGIDMAIKSVDVEKLTSWLGVSLEDASDILNWEVSQLAKLRHPNIVSMVGRSAHTQFPIVGMELCSGDLDGVNVLEVPAFQKWCWAWEMAAGLAYLHEMGLVHRDLKPENILLRSMSTSVMVAKLGDMGLCELDPMLVDMKTIEPDRLKQLIGDTHWASPEELRACRALNESGDGVDFSLISAPTVDMYSYGMTVGFLMNGKKPGDLRGHEWDVDSSLESVVRACTSGRPENRPSALQVLGYLEQTCDTSIHPHPLILKLVQRLGIHVVPWKSELEDAIVPSVSVYPVLRPDEYWFERDEGIQVDTFDDTFFETFGTFLHSKNDSTCVLLGSGGVGKTFASNLLVYRQWLAVKKWLKDVQEYNDTQCPWLPILIRPGCKRWHSSALNVTNILCEYYQLNEVECAALKEYPVLFVVDGYDELPDRVVLPEVMNMSEWSRAKLLVTSRVCVPAYNLHRCFGSNIMPVYIAPFSLSQILQYMSRREVFPCLKELLSFAQLLCRSSFTTVLRTPFLLKLFLPVFPTLSTKECENFDQPLAIQRFLQMWVEKIQTDLPLTPYWSVYEPVLNELCVDSRENLGDSMQLFVGWVCRCLFDAGQVQGDMSERECPTGIPRWFDVRQHVRSVAKSVFSDRLKEFEKSGKSTRVTAERYGDLVVDAFDQVQHLCPLQWDGKKACYFVHKMFFDELWASALLLVLRRSVRDDTSHTMRMLSLMLPERPMDQRPAVLEAINRRWMALEENEREESRDHLVKFVKNTRVDKQCSANKAGNAMTIMNWCRSRLCFDFTCTRIHGANLNRALCIDANFGGAELKDVTMQQACLVDCKLEGATLTNVCLDETVDVEIRPHRPDPAVLGHQEQVACSCHNGELGVLITTDMSGVVKVWNTARGLLKCTFYHPCRVLAMAVNPHTKQVLIADLQNYLYVYSIDGEMLTHSSFLFKDVVTVCPSHSDWVVVLARGVTKFIDSSSLVCTRTFGDASKVCATPEGKLLAIQKGEHVVVYDCVTQRVVGRTILQCQLMCFNTSGSLMASWFEGTGCSIHDGATGECLRKLSGVEDVKDVVAMTFVGDSYLLLIPKEGEIVCCSAGEYANVLFRWKMLWPSEIRSAHVEQVRSFSNEIDYYAFLTDVEGSVHCWGIQLARERLELHWLRMGQQHKSKASKSFYLSVPENRAKFRLRLLDHVDRAVYGKEDVDNNWGVVFDTFEALNLCPDDVQFHVNMAIYMLFYEQDTLGGCLHYEVALRTMKMLQVDDKERSSHHHNLACCYHAQSFANATLKDSMIEKARVNFEIAVSLNRNSGVLIEYAQFLLVKNEYEACLEKVRIALDIANVGAGLRYDKAEYDTVADDLLRNEIDVNGEMNFTQAKILGFYIQHICLMKLSNIEAAKVQLKRFEKHAVLCETALALRLLAYCHEMCDDSKNARSFFEMAVKIDADDKISNERLTAVRRSSESDE